MASHTTNGVSLNGNGITKCERPKVGVGVLISSPNHPGCILIGKRKGSIMGAGKYALPGGHLEFGESWEECTRRETMEETSLLLGDVSFAYVQNTVVNDLNYHYVTIFTRSEVDISHKAEPENPEPEKCEGWEWIKWNELPSDNNLFWSLLVAKQQGLNPFQSVQKNVLKIP
ncbi:nucleotide triphosphate diphosphatase NUDT15-like [Saccoglossus kowalevskii]|uniref:Probable 8-oxo-dGTP diphosphatase NUDT15-like n=1 Tax=Saccoglossus kowalevskii TaxID=10224 RepID=A0ABM0H0I2_SACKO|nr:PREDICTED: probable 8-oxo-dGTP diphosphatase NUDT15-like [Saccoglossus kowalevskii]